MNTCTKSLLISLLILGVISLGGFLFLNWLIKQPLKANYYNTISNYNYRVITAYAGKNPYNNKHYAIIALYLMDSQYKSDPEIIDFIKNLLYNRKTIDFNNLMRNKYHFLLDSLIEFRVLIYHVNYSNISEYYGAFNTSVKISNNKNIFCICSLDSSYTNRKIDTCFIKKEER